MSNKKKKFLNPWILCDNCSICLHERDAGVHEKDCPPSDPNISYPFTLRRSLTCALEVLTTKDAASNNLPIESLNSLVFMSNAALQLCDISIGSWVTVTLSCGQQIARKAWRGNDRIQLTAALTEQDAALASIGKSCISPLPESLEFAGEILLDGVDDSDHDITAILQEMNKNKVFCVGNAVTQSFYGRVKTFIIKKIIPLSHEEVPSNFFKTLPNTIWRIGNVDNAASPEKYVNFAGMTAIQEEIDETLSIALSRENSGHIVTRGILLHGKSGTGKSLLANSAAKKASTNVVTVSSSAWIAEKTSYYDAIFQRAIIGGPAVIIIDNLDVHCGKSSGGNDNKEAFALAALFDRLHKSKVPAIVLATTCNINDISRCLRRSGRFDKEFEITAPSPQERFEILRALLGSNHAVTAHDMRTIADNAHGYVGADLNALISKAATSASKDASSLNGVHLRKAFPLIRPSAMREITVQVPNVKWEDVGGQEDLKHQLRQAIEWPLKYPESFRRLGVSPPRGLLMYGPPGCSKTLIAKALATESGLNFFSIKGPELFSCWVGDSEKAVREVFRRARQAAPAIVFFDELDALAGERSGGQAGGSQVQDRVLAQLLTELDGVEALGDVVVVGATNRPDRIDAALLRPGRLDRAVYVPLPDAATRWEIFAIQFRKIPVAEDVNAKALVFLTEGYSGAEVAAVCQEAAMEALNEDITLPCVYERHFVLALAAVTPRTSHATLQICEDYRNKRIT